MPDPDAQVVAEGWTTDGDRWTLTLSPSPAWSTLMVHVTSPQGRKFWGTGCGLQTPLDEQMSVTTGSDDAGPSVLLLQLRADVQAAVVRLSDGTREDLRLHSLPGRPDAAAVLVYPRSLDVHRIDLYDTAGARLPS